MNAYAQVLIYAIPAFIVLIIIEWVISLRKGLAVNYGFDTISSISSGITNVTKDILGLAVIILSYSWMVNHWSLVRFEAEWIHYVIAFVALDFAGYWVHRIEHTVNLFWNRHIIHHSSEEFNLSCALRQNVSAVFGWFTILLLPAALFGVPAEVIAVVAPLHLFAQFWYHTRLIEKMGILEHVIVTPSHHRVHHAINDIYLDKNFSQIFIVWDKMFGTFQEERADTPPVYGVKKQVNTWNPILINFQHLWLIFMDAWRAGSWKDKIRIWFMPTGWRPRDVAQKYPVDYIQDPYAQVKYRPNASNKLLVWTYVQLSITLFLFVWMLLHFAEFDFVWLLVYGAFVFISVYSFTSLADLSIQGLIADVLRMFIVFFVIYQLGDWYTLPPLIMFLYIFISVGASIYFTVSEVFHQKNQNKNIIK